MNKNTSNSKQSKMGKLQQWSKIKEHYKANKIQEANEKKTAIIAEAKTKAHQRIKEAHSSATQVVNNAINPENFYFNIKDSVFKVDIVDGKLLNFYRIIGNTKSMVLFLYNTETFLFYIEGNELKYYNKKTFEGITCIDRQKPISSLVIDEEKLVFYWIEENKLIVKSRFLFDEESSSFKFQIPELVLDITIDLPPDYKGEVLLKLDSKNKRLFYLSERGITYCNLKDKGRYSVVNPDNNNVSFSDFVVDSKAQKLFWIDKDLKTIKSFDLKTNKIQEIVSLTKSYKGLAIDEYHQQLYWFDDDDQKPSFHKSNLMHFWSLNEGNGTIVSDLATPQNDYKAPLNGSIQQPYWTSDLPFLEEEKTDSLLFNSPLSHITIPPERIDIHYKGFTIEFWARVGDYYPGFSFFNINSDTTSKLALGPKEISFPKRRIENNMPVSTDVVEPYSHEYPLDTWNHFTFILTSILSLKKTALSVYINQNKVFYNDELSEISLYQYFSWEGITIGEVGSSLPINSIFSIRDFQIFNTPKSEDQIKNPATLKKKTSIVLKRADYSGLIKDEVVCTIPSNLAPSGIEIKSKYKAEYTTILESHKQKEIANQKLQDAKERKLQNETLLNQRKKESIEAQQKANHITFEGHKQAATINNSSNLRITAAKKLAEQKIQDANTKKVEIIKSAKENASLKRKDAYKKANELKTKASVDLDNAQKLKNKNKQTLENLNKK